MPDDPRQKNALLIATSVIAAVRTAREEEIEPNSPRIVCKVDDSVSANGPEPDRAGATVKEKPRSSRSGEEPNSSIDIELLLVEQRIALHNDGPCPASFGRTAV